MYGPRALIVEAMDIGVLQSHYISICLYLEKFNFYHQILSLGCMPFVLWLKHLVLL